MSFFEPPAPRPSPPERSQPEWMGPADNVLGAAVPLRIVLARSDQVALAITDVTAYPNGIELNVALRVRDLSADARRALMHGGPFHLVRFPGEPATDGIPPEVLRLGVEFSDGRKATTLDEAFARVDVDTTRPVLISRGGGGGDRSWNVRFWLWPLPPPGPLAFVAEWPLGGIGLTRIEVDAGPIIEAAQAADVLWPDGRVSGAGHTTTVTMLAVRDDEDESGESSDEEQ